MACLLEFCCCGLSGEELYRDWDNHPAVQQYTFIKRLGEGGFSEVQLAQDKVTGKKVALKIIFLNRTGLTTEQRRILAGEAKLIRMVAHPNIIRCMQVLETRRQQVLVLEHLSGGEMLHQLQRVKRYTEAHACQLFRQIVDAVAYLHALSIMHRDIKPENCLLAKPAQHYAAKNKAVKVKLIDLGMAGLYRPRKPLYGCMGSPGFIAPEVVLGDAHTPAMDIYSLGVLLFVMLVGRKPWDAQRSHTLQYAIEATSAAPGLLDPGFLTLSQPARELLLVMLHEDPTKRPTAVKVLAHKWMLQGTEGMDDAVPERLIQPAVQQRLRMLGNSRQVLGTARGMLLLHSRGSRSGAVAFHKAVKEARLNLQHQAAALKQAGQLQQLTQPDSVTSASQPISAAATADQTSHQAGAGATVSASSADPVGSSSSSAVPPALMAVEQRALVTTSAPLASAVPAAAGAGTGRPLGRLSATVGQLARRNLTQRSLLFDGKPPALAAPAVAGGASTAGAKRACASSDGAVPAAAGTGAPARHGCAVDIASPQHALVCEALERGMSLPNPEFTPVVPPAYLPCHAGYKAERAVSCSPGALALLDADDRLCLLAAGTSLDDDSGAVFSWGATRGAADMLASFKQQYPMKPIMKSIARFGHSLSSSISRSLQRSGGLSMSYHGSARHTAGGNLSTLSGLESCCSGAQTAARAFSLSSAGGSSDLDQLLPRHEQDSSQAGDEPDSRQPGLNYNPSSSGSISRSPSKAQRGCEVASSNSGSKPIALETAPLSSTGTGRMKLGLPPVPRPQGAAASTRTALAASAVALHSSSQQSLQEFDSTLGLVTNASAGSLELAFLGTQLSMSPPILSPQASSDDKSATAAEAASKPAAVSASLSNAGGTSSPDSSGIKYKQQVQQGAGIRRGHLIQAVPHVLPAIPSEASFSSGSYSSHTSERSAPGEASSSGKQNVQACGAAAAAEIAPCCTADGNTFSNHGGDSGVATAMAGSRLGRLTAGSVSPHEAQQQQRSRSRPSPFSASLSVSDAGPTANATTDAASLPKRPGSSSNNSSNAPAAAAAGGARFRTVLNSPSMRAAATAAAARAEEEGFNLPNGLWLQLSQSVDSSLALTSPLAAVLSASSLGQQASLLGDANSLTNVEFALKQEADEQNEFDELRTASEKVLQHSHRASQVLEVVSCEAEATDAAAEHCNCSSRHTRHPSVTDWMINREEMLSSPVGRDASVMHWLAGGATAPATAADSHQCSEQQQQQPEADVFSSLSWLNQNSSRSETPTADVGIVSSGASRMRFLHDSSGGSCSGGRHAIPVRASAQCVAVPYSRQHHGKYGRRSWQQRRSMRKSRSLRTSIDGNTQLAGNLGQHILADLATASSAAVDGGGTNSEEGGGLLSANSVEQTGDANANEMAEFYVGGYSDRQGLDAAAEQSTDLGDRMGSSEQQFNEVDAVLLSQATESTTALAVTAFTESCDDGLLLGAVDCQGQQDMQAQNDGALSQQLALGVQEAAAVVAAAADIKSGKSASSVEGGSNSSSSLQSTGRRSSKQLQQAAAVRALHNAAMQRAATKPQALQQYQQYQKCSAGLSINRRAVGDPACVASGGGAWYHAASTRSSSSDGDDAGAAVVATDHTPPPSTRPASVAFATSASSGAFDRMNRAGGVAWDTSSSKYQLTDDINIWAGAAPRSRPAPIGAYQQILQQHQQPTFDDFDEPTGYHFDN